MQTHGSGHEVTPDRMYPLSKLTSGTLRSACILCGQSLPCTYDCTPKFPVVSDIKKIACAATIQRDRFKVLIHEENKIWTSVEPCNAWTERGVNLSSKGRVLRVESVQSETRPNLAHSLDGE